MPEGDASKGEVTKELPRVARGGPVTPVLAHRVPAGDPLHLWPGQSALRFLLPQDSAAPLSIQTLFSRCRRARAIGVDVHLCWLVGEVGVEGEGVGEARGEEERGRDIVLKKIGEGVEADGRSESRGRGMGFVMLAALGREHGGGLTPSLRLACERVRRPFRVENEILDGPRR